MTQQRVHVGVAVANLDERLSSDERESGLHLQQDALDVVGLRGLFESPFRARVGGTKEI